MLKLRFEKTGGSIVDETDWPVAFMSRAAHQRWPDLATQLAAAPELLEVVKQQHEAIDRLFALLVIRSSPGEFLPSQSGQPWDAAMAANELIRRLENGLDATEDAG